MGVTVNVHEAKTTLSKLLERVRLGEEVIIAKAGRAVARLVPIGPSQTARAPGTARGKMTIADDFDEPLPEEVLQEFEA